MTHIRTNLEIVLEREIASLEEALANMMDNDHGWTHDYVLVNKKLKALKKAYKRITKLSQKRMKQMTKKLFKENIKNFKKFICTPAK